ncbi:glycoside hydrolase family 43 protein (plasmid) [Deinococcus radiomollis]|uniref:glycoside hydrolase family 43 protein n=1 Tax=Deinococcus radiomollis TaxID=468916 RepID=UPI003892561E
MKTFMRRPVAVPYSVYPQREDLPDPNVLPVPGGYYIYSTNHGQVNVPVLFSRDLEHFQVLGDAMPVLPRWARRGLTWAPDVTAASGEYRLYFTARLRRTQYQVIGVATSRSPQGPFTATKRPLVRMLELGGAIDPAVHTSERGTSYLYWKNDGNAAGQQTWLWGAELTQDGLGLASAPVPLLSASETWEHNLVEAPQVIEEGGIYHLLYSCADFGNESYAVGHAWGDHPLGPFTKTCDAPILSSYGEVAGPGHSHAFRTESGEWRLAYHGWEAGRCGYPHGRRSLHLAPLHFGRDGVRVGLEHLV